MGFDWMYYNVTCPYRPMLHCTTVGINIIKICISKYNFEI